MSSYTVAVRSPFTGTNGSSPNLLQYVKIVEECPAQNADVNTSKHRQDDLGHQSHSSFTFDQHVGKRAQILPAMLCALEEDRRLL